MCGCAAAFVRSLARRRRRNKEQNATARDVPVMSREMSTLVLEEPGPSRAPETAVVAEIKLIVANRESKGHEYQDEDDLARSAATSTSAQHQHPKTSVSL